MKSSLEDTLLWMASFVMTGERQTLDEAWVTMTIVTDEDALNKLIIDKSN